MSYPDPERLTTAQIQKLAEMGPHVSFRYISPGGKYDPEVERQFQLGLRWGPGFPRIEIPSDAVLVFAGVTRDDFNRGFAARRSRWMEPLITVAVDPDTLEPLPGQKYGPKTPEQKERFMKRIRASQHWQAASAEAGEAERAFKVAKARADEALDAYIKTLGE